MAVAAGRTRFGFHPPSGHPPDAGAVRSRCWSLARGGVLLEPGGGYPSLRHCYVVGVELDAEPIALMSYGCECNGAGAKEGIEHEPWLPAAVAFAGLTKLTADGELA